MSLPVFIRSYQRPEMLMDLLMELEREKATCVHVFDDHSTKNMSAPGAMVRRIDGWVWHRLRKNHGKKYAWLLWNQMFQEARRMTAAKVADRFVFLDDDMRICRKFFELIDEHWSAIKDPRTASLMLMVDSREAKKCWTNVSPQRMGVVSRTQWVDGAFVLSSLALAELEWRLREVPASRWGRDREISTGVGEQLSRRLYETKFGMYRVQDSLVDHMGHASIMNPKERRRNPLRARRFVDGKLHVHAVDTVQASLATIPQRCGALAKVVKVLLPQVDTLRVYLNGYKGVPDFLNDPKIIVARSRHYGDLGDAGKFFWSDESEGYQLICDDDIWYPRNYANRMVAAIDQFQRKAVFGVHGVTFHNQLTRYYRSRSVCHFNNKVDEHRVVHLVGTGTLAYHASTIKVSKDDFKLPNMADVFFGLLCQQQKVPVYVVKRSKGWLKPYQVKGSTIYSKHNRSDHEQTKLVRSVWPWKLWRHEA